MGLVAILSSENMETVDLGIELLSVEPGFMSQANFSKHIKSLALRDLNMSTGGLIHILQ